MGETFLKMRNHLRVDEFYQPDCVGLPKEGDNPHERNNRWALYSALAYGIDNVRLIAVWDGKNDVVRDLHARLVKHMVDLMRDTGGIIEHINPFKLARSIAPNVTPKVHSEIPATAEKSTKPVRSKARKNK